MTTNMTGVDAARKAAGFFGIEPEEVEDRHTLIRLPNGAAMWIEFRTIDTGDNPHDCADVRYWAPDGTPMSLGVFTISDGARGPSEARIGHGWDGGDMVALLADHQIGPRQTVACRNNGDDYYEER